MGKSGPKSKHPSGVGYTTKEGYHRVSVWDTNSKSVRMVFGHVLVWEGANGPVPDGMQLHHKNEDKQDNRIDNLELVDSLTHKRLHSGCKLVDGVWWKPCNVCSEFKPIDTKNWYFAKGYPAHGRCKACHIKRVVAYKQQKRKAASDV